MLENAYSEEKADPVDKNVGQRLKMRRIMLGLTQQDIGKAVNVSIQQIQKYEKASNRISSGKLYAFAKLLDVPINFFFNDTENDFQTTDLDQNSKSTYTKEIPENELLKIVKAYSSIKDVYTRRKILDLLKVLPDMKSMVG